MQQLLLLRLLQAPADTSYKADVSAMPLSAGSKCVCCYSLLPLMTHLPGTTTLYQSWKLCFLPPAISQTAVRNDVLPAGLLAESSQGANG
jgi:hypothetical protein